MKQCDGKVLYIPQITELSLLGEYFYKILYAIVYQFNANFWFGISGNPASRKSEHEHGSVYNAEGEAHVSLNEYLTSLEPKKEPIDDPFPDRKVAAKPKLLKYIKHP